VEHFPTPDMADLCNVSQPAFRGDVQMHEMPYTRQNQAASDSAELESVRAYWDRNVDAWKIATQPAGSPEFFAETEAYRFEKLHYLPELVDFAGFPGQRLLEVGCGLANDLSRFAAGGAHVTGIDLSPRAIELSRQNFAQRGLSGDFMVMNGEAMTFDDCSFDVVYCHTVLHFTPSPGSMIREIHRVLKPGGTAILMTLNRRSWMNVLRLVMRVEVDHLDSPVYRRSSFKEFERMLSVFSQARIVPERFPVPTKVHKGLKARLYNDLFVGVFNAMPSAWTRRSGHHLMAFCQK
jgi:2-polyprenyl-3-methyl-5-hydroxy-6-metoxy-1,4-benzoquinol methylase